MTPAAPVRILTFHAPYRCQHSGRCCASAWPIPVDVDRLPSIERAVAGGALRAWDGSPAVIRVASAPPETPAILAMVDGRCVFHRARDPRGCEVHRVLGHDALPLACRQFPRVTVVDPRGASVTLSHYCPTVAGLLDDETPVAIAINPPAFPAGGEYVGLDARNGVPPLLRPDMAMDWESWWIWEQQAIDVVATSGTSGEALARLGSAVERARRWSPGDVPLERAVRDAFDAPPDSAGPAAPNPGAVLAAVLDAVPQAVRPSRESFDDRKVVDDRRHLRLLAAHAFANWTAHLGHGLRTWLRSVQATSALLDAGLAVDDVDLLLRHLADPQVLADVWGAAERA